MSPRPSALECVPVGDLGTRLATLRLRTPDTVSAMARSLERRGQLASIIVHRTDDGLEVIDGFKRVFAARAMGLAELRAETWLVDTTAAKAAMSTLNEARGLDELEQAWVVRSLYRDDGLTQPAIAVLLGRAKSWVCRRLALAESRNTVRKILIEHARRREDEHVALSPKSTRTPRQKPLDAHREMSTDLLSKYPKITAQRVFEDLRAQRFHGRLHGGQGVRPSAAPFAEARAEPAHA